jgi:predicted transcriptional regulator
MSSGENAPVEHNVKQTQQFEASVDEVFYMIGDPECLAILQATSDSAQTAPELEDQLEIPCSTLYRKIRQLIDTSLLEERIRPRMDGHHSKEYETTFKGIYIETTDDEEVALFED